MMVKSARDESAFLALVKNTDFFFNLAPHERVIAKNYCSISPILHSSNKIQRN